MIKYTGKTNTSGAIRNGVARFFPDQKTVDAVNQAILLEKPLLLLGEPGCGKTALGQAVAFELGLPLFSWYVKSSSRVSDGLYIFDEARHLQDAQTARASLQDINAYIQLGPIGRAFASEQQAVLLIDEIDNAGPDFCADLVLILDQARFIISETAVEIRARKPPIVFVTTNSSKPLPSSFLRACYSHQMSFPAEETLMEIARANFPSTPGTDLEKVTREFARWRMQLPGIRRPGVKEYLDWIRVLSLQPDEYESVLRGLQESYLLTFPAGAEMRGDRPNSLMVFLCHSSADKPLIRILYNRLLNDGMRPWLDEIDLLPGQDWEQEIRKAVQKSDIVLVCLSKGAASKRGYIHKEIKFALDVADEQPEGSLFLIPLKLDPCEVPERLTRWQWVNYFEENGYERLLKALKYRAAALGKSEEV